MSKTDNISDGYHTFGELYEHRTVLFAFICSQNQKYSWKSKKHDNEKETPMYKGFFIAGIETPYGNVTYHCEDKFWNLFQNVKEKDKAPVFDGCSPEEGLKRFVKILPFLNEIYK